MVPGPYPGVSGNDLGVHLTLTSEWTDHRLTPLTSGPTLRDATGKFWPTLSDLWSHVDPKEAADEMKAQITAAYKLGIDVTHLDTHMGAVAYPDLTVAYHQLALDNGLPALLPEDLFAMKMHRAILDVLESLLAESPLPRFRIIDGYGVPPQDRRQWYIDKLSSLGPGVYHLMHHSTVSNCQEEVLPDQEGRKADFEALQDEEVRRIIGEFVPLTYREVRDALRRSV